MGNLLSLGVVECGLPPVYSSLSNKLCEIPRARGVARSKPRPVQPKIDPLENTTVIGIQMGGPRTKLDLKKRRAVHIRWMLEYAV